MRKTRELNNTQEPITEPYTDTALDGELARLTGLNPSDALLLTLWLCSAIGRVPTPILMLSGHLSPFVATVIAELLGTKPHLLPATLPDVPEPASVVYNSYVPTAPPDAIWSRIALQSQAKPVAICSCYPLETPLLFGSVLPLHLPALSFSMTPLTLNPEQVRDALLRIAEYPYDDGELPDADLPNSDWVGWCASRAGAFGASPFEFVDAYRECLTREFEGACAREPILRKIRESAMKGDYAFTPHNLAAELSRFYPATPRRVLETTLQYAGAFAMHGYTVAYDGVMVRIARKREVLASEREQQNERVWGLVEATLSGDPDRLQTAQTIWRTAKRHGFPELTMLGERRVEAGAANYARYLSRASEEGLLALLQRLVELDSRRDGEPAGERDAPELALV